ncbi:MAG: toxic anion resistance protein [Selenomonas sp.]|uniref:toxic anion resistance protein n=1 Tax=Selenomonas sp. TaxID=2053611 RepID=UPI0025DE82BD|nr:toxic anion resistance protein [Selenomonas sp.]MCI6099723.1 toxic anion resistance protein [Selenomonas sp.]MCI6231912.1 toxic anion resistance protein [Selenomonas sp.]
MADINLDDLLKAKKAEAPEGEANVPVPTAAEVERTVTALSPEERAKVDKIKDAINLQDSQTALTFGAPAQKEIADFSDSILQKVRTKDSGPVGDLLSSLVTNVREYNESQNPSVLSKIPFFGGLVDKARETKAGYDKLSTQVDKIQAGLEDARLQMMKDVAVFDALYEKNLSYFKDLQIYIQAGEEKLEEMKTQTLPKLHAQAQASQDPMAVQVVADFEAGVDRFEKKVHDLKLSRTIAIQTAPQIRLIQNNDKALIDRVQTAIYSTIPLWKNQLVIALGLQSQRRVLDMQRAVSDTTNELLKRNAEMLKANTLETAAENERGIVDIDTVKKVNEDLIATIEETVKIQRDGRAKRAAAEQELAQIEGKLKETLLKYSGRPEQK